MTNWETTAKMFSQLFEKPKMSEKLLQKPPFRYIFDIVQETTKVTGYGANLFEGEELNPGQQKETKLQYLSKLKDLVQIIAGEELAVKPTRIIAGHEPENTNIFLQTIYTQATSGKDYSSSVQKVLVKYNSESLKAGKSEEPPQKPQEDEKDKQKQKKKLEIEQKQQEEEKKKMERRKQKEQQEQKKKQEEEPQIPQQQQQQQQEQQQSSQLTVQRPQQQQQRPQSGYKKPPKVKDNIQTEEKQAKAGPKIIRETAKQQDEDLFVEETGPKSQGIKLSNIDAKTHGKFVNEALQEGVEEQTAEKGGPQIEDGSSKIKLSKVGQRGIKARGKQGQQQTEMVGKDDIETLTNIIQSICQNANPLGKSLEFLNDDIESMNKEREYWRKQFEVSLEKYQQEQRTTEDILQPLLDRNMQIDENIEEVKQKIQNTKAQIIKNTSIIQNLLFSVVQSKQQ